MCATSGAGIAYPSGASEFSGICVLQSSFLRSVLYILICPFSFGHCFVYPSLIYGFWWPHCIGIFHPFLLWVAVLYSWRSQMVADRLECIFITLLYNRGLFVPFSEVYNIIFYRVRYRFCPHVNERMIVDFRCII